MSPSILRMTKLDADGDKAVSNFVSTISKNALVSVFFMLSVYSHVLVHHVVCTVHSERCCYLNQNRSSIDLSFLVFYKAESSDKCFRDWSMDCMVRKQDMNDCTSHTEY